MEQILNNKNMLRFRVIIERNRCERGIRFLEGKEKMLFWCGSPEHSEIGETNFRYIGLGAEGRKDSRRHIMNSVGAAGLLLRKALEVECTAFSVIHHGSRSKSDGYGGLFVFRTAELLYVASDRL